MIRQMSCVEQMHAAFKHPSVPASGYLALGLAMVADAIRESNAPGWEMREVGPWVEGFSSWQADGDSAAEAKIRALEANWTCPDCGSHSWREREDERICRDCGAETGECGVCGFKWASDERCPGCEICDAEDADG